MAQQKNNTIQEILLIVFVGACVILIGLTLSIAWSETNTTGATQSERGTATRDGGVWLTYPAQEHRHGESGATPTFTPPSTIDPRTKQPTLTF